MKQIEESARTIPVMAETDLLVVPGPVWPPPSP